MLIHFEDLVDDFGFRLGEFKEDSGRNKKLEDRITENSPETAVFVNKRNEIEYLDYYFAGDNPLGGLQWLREIINDLPVEGTYTVPELDLQEVKFDKVLKAIQNYYSSKISSPSQKRTARV